MNHRNLPASAYHLDEETRAALMAESQRRREDLAARRLLRATAQTLDIDVDKLTGERRIGFERRAEARDSDDRRRYLTMKDKLDAEAQHHDHDRRFTGARLTGLMGLDS